MPQRTDSRSPKRIVICLDGTGNEIRDTRNTNVVRLFRALENTSGEQITYYDPGVGTFSSAGASTRIGQWYSRLLGLAFGAGLQTNLGEAYSFLMNQWEPGDRIYIFGFSRGAYTARALAGMLHMIGIPRPSSDNLIQYAITTYARRRRWTDRDRAAAAEFSQTVCRAVDGQFSIPVEYLGLWDTVSAPGLLRRDLTFEGTDRLENVIAGRHAISIDEKRRPYREVHVTNTAIEEAWFAGVHSDIGGGLDDPRLADISLLWVLDGALALEAHRRIELRRNESLRDLPVLGKDHRNVPVSRMSRKWVAATYRRRRLPEGACVHASVQSRTDFESRYLSRLNRPVWVDDNWRGDLAA